MDSKQKCTPCSEYMSHRTETDRNMQAVFCPIAQSAYMPPQFMDSSFENYSGSGCCGRSRSTRPNSY